MSITFVVVSFTLYPKSLKIIVKWRICVYILKFVCMVDAYCVTPIYERLCFSLLSGEIFMGTYYYYFIRSSSKIGLNY